MKLKTKIQLFSSLLMLILILLVNIAIYYLFYQMTADSELEQLSEQTNTLFTTLADNPEISEVEAENLLRAYLPADGIIRVIDKNGNPIHQLMKLGEYETLPWGYTTTESRELLPQDNAPDIAIVTKPIIWTNGEHAGEIVTVQVANHLIPLHETMQTLFYVLSILFVIMLIPILIAGNVLSKFLLLPIKQLIETMKENTKQAKWKKINVENRSKDELYEMEMTFNEMIDYLKDNYEKQEMFVSNASHELKTPIQIVKSYGQLLARRGRDNPELFQEAVDAIDSEADRMQKLIEQMLSLAKNTQVAPREKIDLTSLVADTVSTFQGAYKRQFHFIQEVGTVFVNGSRDQLEQVLYILIENALKYSKEKIEIKLSEQNNLATFSVRDYGQGIPETEQSRIFERFYRVDKARNRDTGGTGLGLAIAKTITDQHHGTLSVKSIPGEGSTFSLALPVD
ncbi:HAMP domain-containing sensor histidine kinase [Oceanobacillus chungangensis]|uniref:histidine kinase n=1 Tax=Oceanobacillus chungangensis TaxID=1229152 RepID=A0A3D8PIL6_9BACI|nr:ATP-binding protein [Oceanobacillus chungangensis]RDW15068.1 sensor histidine kinase [Oceanobacillus chungangensis]